MLGFPGGKRPPLPQDCPHLGGLFMPPRNSPALRQKKRSLSCYI